jgi:hypothetical protein
MAAGGAGSRPPAAAGRDSGMPEQRRDKEGLGEKDLSPRTPGHGGPGPSHGRPAARERSDRHSQEEGRSTTPGPRRRATRDVSASAGLGVPIARRK